MTIKMTMINDNYDNDNHNDNDNYDKIIIICHRCQVEHGIIDHLINIYKE